MPGKNILFFAELPFPLIGGMEMHAKYFIEYFSKHSDFTLTGVITKDQEGADKLVTNKTETEIDILHLNKMYDPDIIFFNNGRWIEQLEQIRMLFPRAKFFYRTGGNEILKAPLNNTEPNHTMRQLYWANTLNNTMDVIITNSAYTEERLQSIGITVPFKRFIGGVNVKAFLDLNYQSKHPTTIFCAARFVPYKNHRKMIEVIKQLAERKLKFRVRLAGEGPLLDDIKQQVREYNLNSVVTFLGALENEQVCREIYNANIYMQLSKDYITEVEGGFYVHSEGMGRSILEAITAGTFVIAGKSGALSELIKPPYGVLLDPDSIDNIVDYVEPLIKTPPPKRDIQTCFGWKQIFEGYQLLFQNMVHS